MWKSMNLQQSSDRRGLRSLGRWTVVLSCAAVVSVLCIGQGQSEHHATASRISGATMSEAGMSEAGVSEVASAGRPSASSSRPSSSRSSVSEDAATSFSGHVSHCGLKLEASTIDFGTVYEGTKNSCRLRLKNHADHAVQVIGANASCGCTTVPTELPMVIGPHEERRLTIEMNTSGNVGAIEKIVNVFVTEGQSRFRFPVAVRAQSAPLIDFDVQEIDFGMLKTSESASREIDVLLYHEPLLSADEAQSPLQIAECPSGVNVLLTEVPAGVPAVRQWKMTVSVNGDEIPEESLDADLIVMTPSTVQSIKRIPVRARQHSFVTCHPARVNFGVVRDPDEVTHKVVLSCPVGHSLQVMSTDLLESADDVQVHYDSATTTVVVSVGHSVAAGGFFKSLLQIRYRCDDGPRQTLLIPVMGYRLAAGGRA